MSSFSVCLLLDDVSAASVQALWQRLADDGLPSLATYTHGRHVPHLTLASTREVDPTVLSEVLTGSSAGACAEPSIDPLAVTLQALVAFTRSRCSMAPAPTPQLLDCHHGVHESLTAAGLRPHAHYAPGAWLPHVTLAPRLAVHQLSALARRVYEVLPMAVTLTRLALVDTGTGRVVPL